MPGPFHLPLRNPVTFQGVTVYAKQCTGGIALSESRPRPFHLPLRYPVTECAIHIERPDPASLARYGSGTREHPGAPTPRPDERPWVGKSKRRTKR